MTGRAGHADRVDGVVRRIDGEGDLGEREHRRPRQVRRAVRDVVGRAVATAVDVERLAADDVRAGAGRVEGDRGSGTSQVLADRAERDDRALRSDAAHDVRGATGSARRRREVEQEVRLVPQRVVEQQQVRGRDVVLARHLRRGERRAVEVQELHIGKAGRTDLGGCAYWIEPAMSPPPPARRPATPRSLSTLRFVSSTSPDAGSVPATRRTWPIGKRSADGPAPNEQVPGHGGSPFTGSSSP